MKPVYNTILNILNYKQSSCENFKDNRCLQERCNCRTYSEIWGHIGSTIPDVYHASTIQDFTGMYNGDVVLSPNLLRKSRDQIIKYCWQNIEPGEDYDYASWFPRSIIDRRLLGGSSLIIYGNPWSSSVQFTKKKIGKTLIAAIVMKEAIFQRVKSERLADTYAWVDYTLFINRLIENAKNGTYTEEINAYQDADWLVVDNIDFLKNNENGRQFRASVLDKFFSERFENNKPNILVFQDDISKMSNLQYDFGVTMAAIINSRKSHHVALLEGK